MAGTLVTAFGHQDALRRIRAGCGGVTEFLLRHDVRGDDLERLRLRLVARGGQASRLPSVECSIKWFCSLLLHSRSRHLSPDLHPAEAAGHSRSGSLPRKLGT